MHVFGVIATSLAAAATCAAGPRQDARPPASFVNADVALAEMVRAYRTGPIAERVTITARPAPIPGAHAPATERTSSALVRVMHAPRAQDRVLRLDLGVLTISAHGDELTVVRSDDPSVCMRRRLSGPVSPRSLAPVLPPLALPPIQLALSDDPGPEANITPFTRAVKWRPVESANAGELRFVGSAPGGEGALILDAGTHRVRELSFTTSAGAHLVARCEAIDPGDPAAWEIVAGDRRIVRSLRDLGIPEPPIAAGDIVPALPLQDLATNLWSLEDEFALRAARSARGTAAPAILLLVRTRLTPTDAAGPRPAAVGADGVRTYLSRQRRRAAEHDSPDERAAVPFWRPVLVLEVEDFTREHLAIVAERWRTEARPATPGPFGEEEPECLWTSAGRPLLDRFVRGADVIVAAVAADGRLIGSISVTPADVRDTVVTRIGAMFEDDARRYFIGPPAPR